MEDKEIYHFFFNKSSWVWHTFYWLVAALLMFFIFSNRNYDIQIRLILVSFLIVVSYFITLAINNYLIPKFLFTGRFFIFTYSLIAVFIFTLWISAFSIILILLYGILSLPFMVIPQRSDIIILIAGNVLIVIMAAVIHFVKETYRRLIEKNQLEQQKQITELKLKEANLKLLQGQIHPHFLFNMLNNLYGLVKENVETSREVIVKLSDLLDYMLYECDKPELSLEREVMFITNYIELERIRHDENFNVKTNFPHTFNDIQISPLVLFPFVENAFKHGFHNPSKSFILMSLTIEQDALKFEIENSVSNESNDKYLKQEGKGIGLKNIKERLELIYKEKYLLEINNDEEVFKVKLKIYFK